MAKQKKTFKIFIYILSALIAFQAVSICVLLVKNARLKSAMAEKRVKPAARVAIVLDDWGYNKKNFAALLDLGQHMTIAVLPGLTFSKAISRDANANGVEVILHLPLEAHDANKKPEKGAIYTDMSQKQVLERLQDALNSVGFMKGVSNHMGSKATEDEKLMRFLFRQFKKKNLYFLDSLVTNNSVCGRIAAEEGARFAERSVFLDNESSEEYIKGQLRQLISAAKEKKAVVAIGHDRALTIKAIKGMLPEFRREGIKLVYLSEIVK